MKFYGPRAGCWIDSPSEMPKRADRSRSPHRAIEAQPARAPSAMALKKFMFAIYSKISTASLEILVVRKDDVTEDTARRSLSCARRSLR